MAKMEERGWWMEQTTVQPSSAKPFQGLHHLHSRHAPATSTPWDLQVTSQSSSLAYKGTLRPAFSHSTCAA